MDLPSHPESGEHSVFECFFCNSPLSSTCTCSIIYCMSCMLVAYCSEDCLEDDWYNHSFVCEEFSAVNGSNVLQTSRPWKKHIAGLRKRAARLPDAILCSIPIFRNPRVCHTCHEAQFDLLTLCKCGCICYCSEICASTDKLHQKSCKKLKSLKESYSLGFMRKSFPESLYCAYKYMENFGPEYRERNDVITLNIHVVTHTAYFDAVSWEYIFQDFPNLEQLNLVFVIQGMAYNPAYDKSERLTQLGSMHRESENGIITYSVHQKPYHMFFSSSEYTEPDLVVAYGIPYKTNDIHSEISYCHMTYCKHTVLVLMDSTEELVAQGARDVNAARPVNAFMPLRRNKFRGFGANLSGLDFDVSAPNVKRYITCLYKNSS